MSSYSVFLTIVLPSLVAFVLKIAAMIHPGVPSDKIIDLIRSARDGKIMDREIEK
jgi:hypothetical protein